MKDVKEVNKLVVQFVNFNSKAFTAKEIYHDIVPELKKLEVNNFKGFVRLLPACIDIERIERKGYPDIYKAKSQD